MHNFCCLSLRSKKITLTVNFKGCLIFSSLSEASAVGVPSLHRFRLQCNCSILSLPLSMFVVTVLTTLRSLCFKRDVLFASRLTSSIRSPMNFNRKIFLGKDLQLLAVLAVLCHLLAIHRCKHRFTDDE